jgi:segregation and condensation protein A
VSAALTDEVALPSQVTESPAPPRLALIRGQPLLELPTDLYIPPEALEIFLESFEGPLDLLLYLIRKNALDILDIPMAELTRQYMVYVEAMRTVRLELAAEYLVMAAVMIEIKSRMLLPRPPSARNEEGEDPRDFQPAAAEMIEDLSPRLPEVDPDELRDAWYAVLARARMNRHHQITREQLSVREHMTIILRKLSDHQFVEFVHLFDKSATVPIVVVHFVALLELVKEGLVQLMQDQVFAPIYIRLAEKT